MKAKSRKFPLPLSSIGNRSNYTNNKQPGSELTVETPQTATQNAQQYEARNSVTKDTKERLADSLGMSVKPAIAQNLLHQASGYQSGPKKMIPAPAILEGPRREMVHRLVRQGIKDEAVLDSMRVVPRHQFIEEALRGQAYIDGSLPIGHQQTISQPYIIARMIEIMRNGKKLRNVLEIGTGCGYQAAVLAQLCENVYSIERIKALHELAKKNLRCLRIVNLRLHYGDGMLGLPQVTPFDGIILAAAGMQIPEVLLQQLTIGGRLIAPVGGGKQVLQLVERTGNSDWIRSEFEECYFVPLCPGVI